MRLHTHTPAFENGRVLLPKEAPWLSEYINELTGFPGSRYADQVDSTTQALDYLQTAYRENWMSRVDWAALIRNELQSSRSPYEF
jgi:phage terminase large subunit-like protein